MTAPQDELRAAAKVLRETKPHLSDLPRWLDLVADTWADEPVLQEGSEQHDALALARASLPPTDSEKGGAA